MKYLKLFEGFELSKECIQDILLEFSDDYVNFTIQVITPPMLRGHKISMAGLKIGDYRVIIESPSYGVDDSIITHSRLHMETLKSVKDMSDRLKSFGFNAIPEEKLECWGAKFMGYINIYNKE